MTPDDVLIGIKPSKALATTARSNTASGNVINVNLKTHRLEIFVITKKTQWLACVLSLLFIGGIVRADDGVTFRYKPTSKEKPRYQTTLSMEQTQTIGEQKIIATMKQTSINKWSLEKTDSKGDFHFRTETQQLKVKLKIDPVGEYQFDSTADEQERGSVLSEALGSIYDRLATAAVTVTTSPLGEVKAVSGHKELLSDLLKDNPLGVQFAGGASDDAAKLNFSERFIIFSDKPVKPGDSWETEFNALLEGIGHAKGKRIYNYVGPDKVGEVATEKFTVTLELSIDIDIKANGAEVKGSLSASDSTGTIHFDPELGRVVSMKTGYTFGGDINVTANGMSRAINTSQTQNVERILLGEMPKIP
jgi:hypothetical protein